MATNDTKRAAHTPTPWEARTYSDSQVKDAVGVFAMNARLPIIPSVAGATLAQADANVDFVVRACNAHDELVAALEGLLASYRELRESTGRDRDTTRTMACVAAIKKARGES